MKKQLILTGGHHFNAAGATHNGKSEFPETRIWADTILKYVHMRGMPVTVVSCAPLNHKVPSINSLIKQSSLESICVSVHFNSSSNPKNPSGFETLHYPDSQDGMELAAVCQDAMALVMAGKDRGIKAGYYQMDKSKGVDYILRATNCPCVIIEPEFVQHFDEIESKREECCKAIADAIVDKYWE